MKNLVLALWLLLPVAGVAYHYGPGQERLRNDDAASEVAKAERLAEAARALAVEKGDRAARSAFAEAAEAYTQALATIPNTEVAAQRSARLELAKAKMMTGELPEARNDLEALMDEVEKDSAVDPKFAAKTRSALANSQYYMTWLLRLRGAGKEEWEPEIEGARQNYRLLAESKDPAECKKATEDLEAAVRLSRLELADLQGLPLPSQ